MVAMTVVEYFSRRRSNFVGWKTTAGLTRPLLTTAREEGRPKLVRSGLIRIRPHLWIFVYWRNTHDDDVERFLGFFTFLPMDEVRRLGALRGQESNEAKKVLAYEVTKLAHGEEEAKKAQKTAEALFGAGKVSASALPVTQLTVADYPEGVPLLDLVVLTGLVPSKKEGRRLIDQRGLYLDGSVTEVQQVIAR